MRNQTFHSMAPLALVAILVPLGLRFWQDPVPEVGDDPAPAPVQTPATSDGQFFGSNETGAVALPIQMRIRGAWKLTSIDAPDYPQEGRDLLGYLLITDNFLSMEVQAFWDDTLEDAPNDAFETLTAEYRTTKEGFLEAKILMGSYIDRNKGRLEWYKSERPRRFVATPLGDDGLQLEWKDRNIMTFPRHKPSTTAERDFFGAIDPALSNVESFYEDSDLGNEPEPAPDPDDEGDEDRGD
ncbi:MAG: hypothetical protein KDB61_08225 [Planctomycetes bacterium]|nr:hypothetical protein [Planctomycetota bacterium]